jgi:N-acetylneuraminic acid mutarotase
MVVCGGEHDRGILVGDGAAYDPQTDTWRPISSAGSACERSGQTALWTGSEMIIWGGTNGSTSGGGRYDPVADSWTPISTLNAPPGANAIPVWTGTEMISWSGTGGRYSPDTDIWTSIADTGDPEDRHDFSVAWTGSELVIWGGAKGSGSNVECLKTGARYDPVADIWTAITEVGSPPGKRWHTTIWTGTEMIVWAGNECTGEWTTNTGGVYAPTTDSWRRTNAEIPVARTDHTGVWTGNVLVIWGGTHIRNLDQVLDTGGRYDPLVDLWTPTSTMGAPDARGRHSAVWTGEEMLIWGGEIENEVLDSGGRYDPVADTWAPIGDVGAPGGRSEHAAAWTGSQMVVWGGQDGIDWLSTGGRYDPATDTWLPTTTMNAPTPRYRESAVWSGSELIVWGGQEGTNIVVDTGARYDPIADTWTPTSMAGAPSPRFWHAGVWTGSEMIIWGGQDRDGAFITGGRYDPATDTWTPTSTVGTPDSGGRHAVWAGSMMLVWWANPQGGRYEPVADAWTPMTTANSPTWRSDQAQVWTGAFMAIWGGERRSTVDSGGRYFAGGPADLDGDGFACDGECDDLNPATFPGAPEICDGLDNDCDGVLPENEEDADADDWPSCADCDDADPARFPGNPEVCDGLDNDCDTAVDEDEDLDSFPVCVDCDDAVAETFPGATEVNDGLDNECTGDPGFGLMDDLTGSLIFPDGAIPSRVCWPAQAGATHYTLLRSPTTGFDADCFATATTLTCLDDLSSPAVGTVHYYLARSSAPHGGSAGAGSSGLERVTLCTGELICNNGIDDDGDGLIDCEDVADCLGQGACVARLQFEDTAGDDLGDLGLETFFASFLAVPSDYLHFSLTGDGIPDFEWCAQRADFYQDRYLELAAGGGSALSGAWDKWYREEGGSWTGPVSDPFQNLYGINCSDAYAWCSEILLGGLHLPTIVPTEVGLCEVFDNTDCGGTLTITIAVDRLAACGF